MSTKLSLRAESMPRPAAALSLSLAEPGRAVALRDYLLRLGASAEIQLDHTIFTAWDGEDDLAAFVVSWSEINRVGVDILPAVGASFGGAAAESGARRAL
jgi:hypothetical protein